MREIHEKGGSRSTLRGLPHLLGGDLISVQVLISAQAPVTVIALFAAGLFAHALPRGFTTLAHKATLTLFR